MGLVKSSHPPFQFTIAEYDGLLAASLSATIISLLASFAGLVVHFLLLWYDHHRPDNENYSTNFDIKSTTSASSIAVKDGTSSRKNSLKPTTQYGRKTHHFDSSPTMKTPHHRRHYLFKKSSSTGAMNRVSLRLIVLACISYSIYSVSQLVVTGIAESVLACRILAYFIVCFDVMGSICLGLVGFNLVLVFVVNVKHPERFEKYYYATAIIISIFVFVPPLVLKAGRTIDKNDSCWYHFFFEGRRANPFNWLYYYSWLLFASILATVSSIIAIRKVILEKNNFAHTINMLKREEASYPRPAMYPAASSASTHFHRNTNLPTITPQQPQRSQTYSKMNAEKNSELFRRVAIRCICYALVPVLCKSWGIGIEIAITSGIVVNYPILVIDRFMACIMGFFVSCIYFSDPSVRMVWQDMMMDYKKRYVDQFYYVDITKIIRLDRTPNGCYPSAGMNRKQYQEEDDMVETVHIKNPTYLQQRRSDQRSIYTIMNFAPPIIKKQAKYDSLPKPVYIYDSALRRPMKYHPPSRLFQRLSNCQKKNLHEKEMTEKKDSSQCDRYSGFLFPFQCMKRNQNNIKWVPMRRIDVAARGSQNRTMLDDTHSTESQPSAMSMGSSELLNGHYSNNSISRTNGENNSVHNKRNKSRLLEPYSHPKLAKLIYLFFVYLLFYRPPYYHRQKRTLEKKLEKGKEIQLRQRTNSPSDTNEHTSVTDSDDNDNMTTCSSNSEEENQSGHKNVVQGNTVLFTRGESAVLSSSPSSLSQDHETRQPCNSKITHLKLQTNEKNVNTVPIPPSTASPQNTQASKEVFDKTCPPLRPGSRNRVMSSSFIKSNQEKAREVNESNTQGETIVGRSSSYPLLSSSDLPDTASRNQVLPTTPTKVSVKQHGKIKTNNASSTAEKAFLDQKLSPQKMHEGPTTYRHIPTIGQLIQSVSPVHSFMSVRRVAANPFAQPLATRPSSGSSGSSSLQSSPIGASSLSLSSSSSSSTLSRKDHSTHTHSRTASGGERRGSFALYKNQRKYYSPPQWSSPQNRLYQLHILYHDYPNRSNPPRQRPRDPVVDDGRKEGTERNAGEDDERNCPYCKRQYTDESVHNNDTKMNIVTGPDEIGLEENYPEYEQDICISDSKTTGSYTETCDEPKKALTLACINNYHQTYLNSSTLLPHHQEQIISESYISGHQQSRPFFIDGGGLSPPSKLHYNFIYGQGERKATPTDVENIQVSSSSSSRKKNYLNRKSPSSEQNDKIKSPLSLPQYTSTYDNQKNNNASDKTSMKKQAHNVQRPPNAADKEIILSGVRTVLLHIKNDMDIDDHQIKMDNQHPNERHRIDMLIDNWEANLTRPHN